MAYVTPLIDDLIFVPKPGNQMGKDGFCLLVWTGTTLLIELEEHVLPLLPGSTYPEGRADSPR